MSCNCKYITLFRGDDSNFEFNQKVALVIKTELDLSGCSAHFSLLGVQQDFETIPNDKTLELVFPSADTAKFPLGMANGKLWLTDAEGRIRTVSNAIHFYLTNNVEKAYGDSAEQTITVDIQSIGSYNALSDKPSINGVTLTGDKTGEELGLADEASISAFREELTVVEGQVEGAVRAASAAESSAASAVSAASAAQDTAASALSAAQSAKQTADDATSALDGKRDVTDMWVRGAPQGEGSWFTVTGLQEELTLVWNGDCWEDNLVIEKTQDGYNLTDGGVDAAFTLDEDFSATFQFGEYNVQVIGYVDTIAKVSEIPTRTSQLTNDSGFITSADVHGDYIEDTDGNRINADRTIEEKNPDAPWVLSISQVLPYTLEKKDSNHWQYEQPESDKLDLIYYAQEGTWEFNQYYWNGSEWEFVTSYPAVNESAIGNPDATYLQLGYDPAFATATRQLTKSGKLALESALADKKDKQTPVTSPTASGNATSFIDTITQDANGVITPTKKTIPAAAPSTSVAGGTAGLMSAADKEKLNGIAAGATKVLIDTTLKQSGAAADAKTVGDALWSGFTEWEFSGNVSPGVTYTVDITEYEGTVYVASLDGSDGTSETVGVDSFDVVTILFGGIGITATRHLVTPTKTSQLTNDGAPNGGGTPYATTAQIPDVTGKADKVAGATAGNLASLTAQGNLSDSGVKPSDFAAKADLPYALVEPEYLSWGIIGLPSGLTVDNVGGSPNNELGVTITAGAATVYENYWGNPGSRVDFSFTYNGETVNASAIPSADLFDRAVNAVSVTDTITLTLPSLVTGKSRDFYLKMTVTGSQSVSFSPSTGITYTGLGDPSKTYSAGTYLMRFTETSENEFCVASPLSASQVLAIDSVVEDRQTVATYSDGTTLRLDISGSLSGSSVPNRENLVGIRVGSAVTGIGQLSFAGCTSLAGVEMPDSVVDIGDEAFSDCSALTSVELPDSVESIGDLAFSGCVALASVSIPGSVTSIGEGAFADCTSLTDLTMPCSLSEIGLGAFEYCSGLTSVTFKGKTLDEVKGMSNYPWGINTGIIRAEKFALESDLPYALVAKTPANGSAALSDRAVNAVPVTGATTLTLPALVNAGKSRDLLVRLTVSADSAVTFSAPSGETVTWDDAGSPTATYEAGTHLLRFTEVGLDNGSYIFHFADLGAGGSIDPAVLNGKLEATSAAPPFDDSKTYSVSEYVTYEGVLYECSTAVTTAGAWTGSTNWTATNMTTPDATLDLMADGRLRLVSADGDVLWMQGYGLASASSVTLSCDRVNFHAFAAVSAFDATASYSAGDVVAYDGVAYEFTAAHAAGAWTGSDASVYAVALAMPTAPSGKVGDFVLDVDNTANASASVTATLTGAGTAFDVFTPEGVNLSTDILTFAGGEQCELYFTMTAFGTAAKPAWKVVKQIVEKQEFGS